MEGALQKTLPPLVCNSSFIGADNHSTSYLPESQSVVYSVVHSAGGCRSNDGEKVSNAKKNKKMRNRGGRLFHPSFDYKYFFKTSFFNADILLITFCASSICNSIFSISETIFCCSGSEGSGIVFE